MNVQYDLPNISITPDTDTSNPVEVVPWTVDLEAYKTLTKEYFPDLYAYIEE